MVETEYTNRNSKVQDEFNKAQVICALTNEKGDLQFPVTIGDTENSGHPKYKYEYLFFISFIEL